MGEAAREGEAGGFLVVPFRVGPVGNHFVLDIDRGMACYECSVRARGLVVRRFIPSVVCCVFLYGGAFESVFVKPFAVVWVGVAFGEFVRFSSYFFVVGAFFVAACRSANTAAAIDYFRCGLVKRFVGVCFVGAVPCARYKCSVFLASGVDSVLFCDVFIGRHYVS